MFLLYKIFDYFLFFKVNCLVSIVSVEPHRLRVNISSLCTDFSKQAPQNLQFIIYYRRSIEIY